MSFIFKGFETEGRQLKAVVFESTSPNSARAFNAAATEPSPVEAAIPVQDYLTAKFDHTRISYEQQKQVAVAIIRSNLDL